MSDEGRITIYPLSLSLSVSPSRCQDLLAMVKSVPGQAASFLQQGVGFG